MLSATLILLLLIGLLLSCAGCSRPNEPATAISGTGSHGDGTQGLFLYQNVVNASGGSNPDPKNTAVPAEDIKAAAIAAAMDSRNPVTRDFAVSLIPRSHGGPFNLAQICDLWDTMHSRWTYVEDPRSGDYFSPASRTIALGLKGDCDDYAIAVAAMIESVGGDTRIISAWDETSGHAYPEVYIGNTKAEFDAAAAYIRQRYGATDVGCHITSNTAGTRYWLNLDWWSRYPGGKFFADNGTRIAYYPDGRYERTERLPGPAANLLQNIP